MSITSANQGDRLPYTENNHQGHGCSKDVIKKRSEFAAYAFKATSINNDERHRCHTNKEHDVEVNRVITFKFSSILHGRKNLLNLKSIHVLADVNEFLTMILMYMYCMCLVLLNHIWVLKSDYRGHYSKENSIWYMGGREEFVVSSQINRIQVFRNLFDYGLKLNGSNGVVHVEEQWYRSRRRKMVS